MTFRRFVYWCALCGGWAALAGWLLGRWLAVEGTVGGTGLRGMFLGTLVAFGLGTVDSVWVFALRQVRQVVPRIVLCVLVGAVGGLLGGVVGQLLYDWQKNSDALLIFGWVVTGLLVGASIGMYDFLRSWVCEEELHFPRAKLLRGTAGGAVGGLLGGVLFGRIAAVWSGFFPGKDNLWSPSLAGFIVLGVCIGLLVAIAQLILTEAWLKVEAGFRKGRELLVNKPVLTIGRAETCDLGLFGDTMIERLHARIFQQEGRFLIADNASTHGTFVNDQRIHEPTLLRSGDLIRVGNAYIRFSERRK